MSKGNYGTPPKPSNKTSRVGGPYGGPVKEPRTRRSAPSMKPSLKSNK